MRLPAEDGEFTHAATAAVTSKLLSHGPSIFRGVFRPARPAG